MSNEQDVTCPLHDGIEAQIKKLFEKTDMLAEKIETSSNRLRDKITLVLIIQVITAFMAGGDILIKVVTLFERFPK